VAKERKIEKGAVASERLRDEGVSGTRKFER
jgi:hypothetical protein